MKILSTLLLALACGFCSVPANAQETPIGQWSSHFPYNDLVSIATDGRIIYAAAELSMFSYDPQSGELEKYSKVNGMADVDMAWLAYDRYSSTLVITYKNGNIDLYNNNTFYNIPDFKQRVINGPKTIYGVYTENGLAYLSTSIGILVLDLQKREIKETYEFIQNQITVPVYGFAATGNRFYTITGKGLFTIGKNHPSPQLFSEWQLLSDSVLSEITVVNEQLFVAGSNEAFILRADTLHKFLDLNGGGDHLDNGNGKLLISSHDAMQLVNTNTLGVEYSYYFRDVKQALMLDDMSYWVADNQKGLARANLDNNPTYIFPNGPAGASSFDIFAYNKNVLVAHGAVTDKWVWRFNGDGFSEYANGEWTAYSSSNYEPLQNRSDFIYITKSLQDGTIYTASFRDGLFMLVPDGTHKLLRESSQVEQSNNNPGTWAVTGLAVDDNNNLWMNFFGSDNELAVKTPDNRWYKYNTPYSLGFPNGVAGLLIDDIGQKWYIGVLGSGVIIYNDNGTLENTADDSYRQLLAGTGAGNLPNNDVYSIAKDKNNAIWIGTRAGIGIVNCTESVIGSQCDAERPIVQFDQFAGYLFETEIVYTIAVDGANRKWVGTANGVWLLSPTGEAIVSRFTAENSPLPSNLIRKITVDPVTGDVYIGTDKGLVCYRGTATDGGETNEESLLAFPNPVPSEYAGSIAIKGLVENADVRITDISGQLIYRTTALGGQAVWNGMDYNGRRPQSGVYLVFASNKDGTETATGKIIFMQ